MNNSISNHVAHYNFIPRVGDGRRSGTRSTGYSAVVIIIIYILVMSNGTKGNDPLSDLIDPFSCLLIT